MLQVREMRCHHRNVLVVHRICAPLEEALVAKNAFCWQQCLFFTHIFCTYNSINQGGANFSKEKSFAENQKQQRAAKLVCSANKNRQVMQVFIN